MKTIFKSTMIMALGLVAFTACEDDNDSNPTIAQPTTFEIYLDPSIDGNVNLDLEKTTDPIVLSWSQPTPYTNYNAPVVPTYTIQVSPTGSFSTAFDATAEDNTGADFFNINETFTSGKRVEINAQSLNRSLEELQGWTEETMPAVQQVSFRVKSAVRDASFNEYGVIYSNVITLNTVPYFIELKPAAPIIWYMVGNCIGNASWSNAADGVGKGLVPMFLVANEAYDTKTGGGLTQFTGYFPADAQFKFVLTPGNWDSQLNFTNVKNPGSFLADMDGDNHNIGITTAGYYTIKVDTKTNDVTVEQYEGKVAVYDKLCIAGSFNDWSDNDMTPVFTLEGSENHIWSYVVDGGVKLKVKIAGSWDTNWGYKNGLAGSADGDGNLVVPEGGKFLLLFNDITGDYMLIEQE